MVPPSDNDLLPDDPAASIAPFLSATLFLARRACCGIHALRRYLRPPNGAGVGLMRLAAGRAGAQSEYTKYRSTGAEVHHWDLWAARGAEGCPAIWWVLCRRSAVGLYPCGWVSWAAGLKPFWVTKGGIIGRAAVLFSCGVRFCRRGLVARNQVRRGVTDCSHRAIWVYLRLGSGMAGDDQQQQAR